MNYQNLGIKFLNTQQAALSELEKLIQSNSFNKTIDTILNATGKIIFTGVGKGGRVVQKSAATFASFGISSVFLHSTEASHGDMGMIQQNDVVICISNSGETIEIRDVIMYCINNKIPIIGVTKNLNSFLGKNSDIVLHLDTKEFLDDLPAPTSSSTALMCLFDIIACITVYARNFTFSDYNKIHPGGKLGTMSATAERRMKFLPCLNKDDKLDLYLRTIVKYESDVIMINGAGYITKDDILNCIDKIDESLIKKMSKVVFKKDIVNTNSDLPVFVQDEEKNFIGYIL